VSARVLWGTQGHIAKHTKSPGGIRGHMGCPWDVHASPQLAGQVCSRWRVAYQYTHKSCPLTVR
jgi:hypothetical protein